MSLKDRMKKMVLDEKDPNRIARGFAVGAAIGVTPTAGVQTILALLFSSFLRGSRVAAVAATFILNPIGYIPPGPWIVANYYVGVFVTGQKPLTLSRLKESLLPKEEELHLIPTIKHAVKLGFDLLLPIGIGSVICAICAALLSKLLIQRLVNKILTQHKNSYPKHPPNLEGDNDE